MELTRITDCISYLPASTKPLSCDIVFIKTDECTWILDVGLNKESVEAINAVEGKKCIVLSHFHPDHILNLGKVKYDKLYVSKNTRKYTWKGDVISEETAFNQSPEVRIVPLPSSHAKGCLALVCGDYAFLGDGTYAKPLRGHHTYNAQLLQQMLQVLESLPVKYFGLSHDENFIQEKEAVIQLYRDIYSRYDGKNSTISVEDFFNSDGSVKK